MKKALILFLTLFSFVASGQSLIFGGSTNAAAREKLKGNASNYTINAPTDSTLFLISTTTYTEIPLSNISSRSLTFTGSNGIAITGGTQTLSTNRTWSTRIDSTSTPVITGLRLKGLGTGLVHSNSVGTLSSSTLVNADVSSSANIDATKLATGVVSNTEFNYLDSLTSQVAISIYNIAELKTKIGRYNQKVNVLGYTMPNDGGGGQFYWNKTSTETADDAMIVQVTGVTTGRWIRIYEDYIYTKWFGDKGDNSNNDTEEIQAALDFAASFDSRKKVILSYGTHSVETLYIPYGVTFEGENNNLTLSAIGSTLKQRTTNDVIRFNALLSGGVYRWFGKLKNISIRGNTSSSTGVGINTLNSSNNTVILQDAFVCEDVVIREMPEQGIYSRGAFPASFNRITLLFNKGSGMKFLRTYQYHALDLTNISGDGNNVLLEFQGLTDNDNVTINNLKSENRVNTAYSDTLQNNAISFYNCSGGLIKINGANHISSVPDGATYKKPKDFIVITGTGLPHIIWSGVNIEVPSGYTGTDPYIINSGNFGEENVTYTVRDGLFNTLHYNFLSAIVNQRKSVTNNATTIDVSKSNLVSVSYTAPTTITNLTGGYDSQIVHLWVNSGTNVTILDASNFDLNGNFVSSSNSMISLVNISGVWREICRTNAELTATTNLSLSDTAPILSSTATNGSSGLRVNILGQSSGIAYRLQNAGSTIYQQDINGNSTTTGNVSTTGNFYSSLGSISSPSHSFTGDTDTGIYSSTANNISIVTGGIAALNIGSTQNIYTGSSVGVNSFLINKTITGGTDVAGIRSSGQIQSDVTANAYLMQGVFNQVSGMTTTSAIGVNLSTGTISGTITNLTNFKASASGGVNAIGVQVTGISGSSTTKGFDSNISSGTNKWNAYFQGTAQNYFAGSVGIGIETPSSKAILDITSTTQGVLLPRMTTTQINAISSPTTGLTVYNTTLNVLCFFDGTEWKKVSHSTM